MTAREFLAGHGHLEGGRFEMRTSDRE